MNPLKAIANLPGKVAAGVNRKVWAATGGAMVAPPLTRILLWILKSPQFGIALEIPDDIAADLESLINIAAAPVGAFLSGYLVRERAETTAEGE